MIKRIIICIVCLPMLLVYLSSPLMAQKRVVNYDESKVPRYTLPDPLLLENGTKVTTSTDWNLKRRPELLALFQKEMFGRMPKVDHSKLRFEELTSKPDALEGKATRKEIRIYFNAPNKEPKLDLLIYYPNKRKGPVATFLALNFQGNHACVEDPDIMLPELISGSRTEKEVQSEKRAVAKRRWPISMIIDAGYAIATGYYEQIEPDRFNGFKDGVHPLFAKEFPNKDAGDYPATITAWAWGLSRALDCLETIPVIDAKRVIVMGHSRLGKTSLWAGANDTRFAAVISNDSGCGGAALSRRAFGETVTIINNAFPHWFCNNFKKYGGQENTLPFDQHELITLIAPRPVYIASAFDDQWADPKGEFLSAFNADSVYRLLKTPGLGNCREMPGVDQPVGNTIRYHVRTGKHDVTDFDWKQYIKMADELLPPVKQ